MLPFDMKPPPGLVAVKAPEYSTYYILDRRFDSGESGVIHCEPRHAALLVKDHGCSLIEEGEPGENP